LHNQLTCCGNEGKIPYPPFENSENTQATITCPNMKNEIFVHSLSSFFILKLSKNWNNDWTTAKLKFGLLPPAKLKFGLLESCQTKVWTTAKLKFGLLASCQTKVWTTAKLKTTLKFRGAKL